MRIKDLKHYIENHGPCPKDPKEQGKWFSFSDAIDFLVSSRDDMVPIYAYGEHLYIYSFIVPEEKIIGDYKKDLYGSDFSASQGYGYGETSDKGISKECLIAPTEWERSEIIRDSTPIFFSRSFEGNDPYHILEINQKISHVLGIFWLDKRKAFCRINRNGDYEDLATMEQNDITLCTLNREELNFYLFLSHSVLIRFFDISRSLDWRKFNPNSNRKEEYVNIEEEETYIRRTSITDDKNNINTAWIRGFQIIRNSSKEKTLGRLHGKDDRKYASFIIWDWKNKKTCEWSSDPKDHGNYFVKSDLPYQTSPAFFRPEVLAKYKQDPVKYRIGPRTINCRATWSIQYDINEEGQIHAYICDLAHLPYQEQLYWKSFNEEPKAGISKRAIKTDFEGSWNTEYDPLLSLKEILDTLPTAKEKDKALPIWKLPDLSASKDIKFLNYVVTESIKEWEDQILALSHILVDGLCKESINKLSDHLKCRDAKLASGKQLAKCLEVAGIKEEEILIFSSPLAELWKLRSSIIAHPGGKPPEENLKKHYRGLLESCDKSMRKLSEFIEKGILNISDTK